MKRASLVVAMVGLLAGCSSASEAATDGVDAVSETHTTSLSGTWTAEDGAERPATVIVEQSALSAKLVVALEGHACLAHNEIDVEVTTDGVKTDADVAGMHLVMEGSPDLEQLAANFDAIAGGPCPGQGGWMAVHR